jgi:DNA-directed RNA polymerase subunit RPC12/RpoP
MRASCPFCGKVYQIKEELLGKRVVCPGCRKAFSIPPPLSDQTERSPVQDPIAASVQVACSHCKQIFRVKREHLGKKVKCKACGSPFVMTEVSMTPDLKTATPGKSKAEVSNHLSSPAHTTSAESRGEDPARSKEAVVSSNLGDLSNYWATIIRWIKRGDGIGFAYFWFFFFWSGLLSILLGLATLLTFGLAALFVVPHVAASYLVLHFRLLYGKGRAPGFKNLLDGFKCYKQILVLALICFGVMVALWIIMYMFLGAATLVLISSLWSLGTVGYLLIPIMAAIPFVVVTVIAIVLFLLPSLMVMDRAAGSLDAVRLTLSRVKQHAKLLLLYAVAIAILLGLYGAIGLVLVEIRSYVCLVIGILVLLSGYGHFLIASPGWVVVVYESFFPPEKLLKLPDGREQPSLIVQEEQQPPGTV